MCIEDALPKNAEETFLIDLTENLIRNILKDIEKIARI